MPGTKPTGATQVGGVYVDIGADINNLKKGLQEAEKATEKTAKTMSQKLTAAGEKMAKAGKGLTVGLTLPILGVGTAMTKMAMDAEESENLFEVSMGNMKEAGRAWSEDLREQLGLNAYETRKMLSTFNVMLDSMGLGEQAAFDMSKGLSQLAYDMASFYNLDPDEAFMKLQAGISGEIEPLKRLGIIVNENTINQVALQHGIIKTGETLTEQQKVQARYIAIMEQTEKAQGDLARTQDSATNQIRKLKSQLAETAVEFGKQLLPVLQKGLEVFQKITEKLANLSDEQKQNILKWAAIAAAVGPVLLGVGKILIVIPKIMNAFKLLQPVLLATKTNLMALIANPVVLGLAAIAAVLVTIGVSAAKGRAAVQEAMETAEKRHAAAVQKMVDDAKAAANQMTDDKIAALQDEAAEAEEIRKREIEGLEKQKEEALRIYNEEADARIASLEEQKTAAEETYNANIERLREEYGVYKTTTQSKMDLVDEYYDHEIKKAEEAYNEKVALLNAELDAQRDRIDRESSLTIGAIEDQIALLEGATLEEIQQNKQKRFASEAIRLEELIAQEKDAEARKLLVDEREGYIKEAVRLAADQNLEAQKWALRELILEEMIKAEERKTQAEETTAALIEEARLQVDGQITELERGRDEEKRILEEERLEKERIEGEKLQKTIEGINGQIEEVDRGRKLYEIQLNKEVIAKGIAEDQKLQKTKERIDAEIAELERLRDEAVRIAGEMAANEAANSEAMRQQELIGQYQAVNSQYQEAIAAMGDDGLLGRTWKTLTGGYRAELAPLERQLEKIAGQLAAMGVPGFATGGIAPAGQLFRANEKEPEIITPASRFDEVIRMAVRSAQSAGAASSGRVIHEHTGTLEVRGVNDRGQLIDIIKVTVDQTLREEARAYS